MSPTGAALQSTKLTISHYGLLHLFPAQAENNNLRIYRRRFVCRRMVFQYGFAFFGVMKTMKILARHKGWVAGSTISESVKEDDTHYRRFVATIDGWRNFVIYEGFLGWYKEDGSFQHMGNEKIVNIISRRVKSIQQRIRQGDDSVFKENTKIIGIL